jgi:hypothetical protein
VALLLMSFGMPLTPTASAHETDQFTAPDPSHFVDLGPQLTAWYYDALQQAVDRANARIDAAVRREALPGELAALESTDDIVKTVDAGFLPGNDLVDSLERELADEQASGKHPPGKLLRYRDIGHNIYTHAFFILDYKYLSRFVYSSTIKAFGVMVGTDKFGHFSSMGVSYYWAYEMARRRGASEEQAMHRAVAIGTDGTMSEAGLMGIVSTGDYANGDLAANFAGFLFYRNLTEPMQIHGALRPPLLQRDGPHWRLAPHVRSDSDFFAPFISDHWNEALNPGWFMPSMRPAIRQTVRAHTADLIRAYVPPEARLTPRQYLAARRAELSTYYGVDYGHRGSDESLVAIDNTCNLAAFPPPLPETLPDPTAPALARSARQPSIAAPPAESPRLSMSKPKPDRSP